MGDKALKKERKEKKERKIPIWVIIVALVVVGLLVAGIVCFILIRQGEKDDLRQAIDLTEKTAETREAVEGYLTQKAEKVELTDEQEESFEDFENAVVKLGDYMRELGERQAVKGNDVKAKYEEAVSAYEKLKMVGDTEQELSSMMSDGVLNDEDLDELLNGDNEYLKNLAKDYKEFRTKVAEFNTKYADLKGKNKTELDTDNAQIQQAGSELAKKYAEIKFEDVYGMSRDDILKFYATIEELNKILAEKN